MIRIVDRLAMSNEYLTFGGHLSATRVDDATVVAITSPNRCSVAAGTPRPGMRRASSSPPSSLG